MPIDGIKIKNEIGEKLKEEIIHTSVKVSLGILCVGNDPASLQFINVKKRFGEKCGFIVNILNLNDDVTHLEIIQRLEDLQKENDGVIVQLPLPDRYKEKTGEILSTIQQGKDVDNLNKGNFQAPIVLALEKVLKISVPNLEVAKQKMVLGVVGLGQVVGIPIKNYLEANGYILEIITRYNFNKIRECDVVIAGVGKPFLIKSEDIKVGSILVDYGCSFTPDPRGSGVVACGDFDPGCFLKAKFYTPVPGCMGPLVVASLFENVLKATKKSMI